MNEWPAYKDQCLFGQIPILKHVSFVLAQSGSINRYLAKLGGLYPSHPLEASVCDMVMDECMNIFEILRLYLVVCIGILFLATLHY